MVMPSALNLLDNINRYVQEGSTSLVTCKSTAVPQRPYVALKMFAPMGCGDLNSSDDACLEEEDDGSPASRSPFHSGMASNGRIMTRREGTDKMRDIEHAKIPSIHFVRRFVWACCHVLVRDFGTYTGKPRGDKGEQKLPPYTGDEVEEWLCVKCYSMFTPEDTTLPQWKLSSEVWASVCRRCMPSVLCRALRQIPDERPGPHKIKRCKQINVGRASAKRGRAALTL